MRKEDFIKVFGYHAKGQDFCVKGKDPSLAVVAVQGRS